MAETNAAELGSYQEPRRTEEAIAVDDRLEKLEQHKKERMARRKTLESRALNLCLTAVVALTFSFLAISGLTDHKLLLGIWNPWQIFISCAYVAVVCLIAVAVLFRWRSEVEVDIEDIEFEITLLRFPVASVETRAEKTLLQHNRQLRRYYTQNLGENEKVFWVGIGCIVLGASIIGLTVYLVAFQLKAEHSKIIVAILGAVGSLLTNYIAAIYLKMHTAAANNLRSFHGRLVETHQILFANLVASRIENNKIRWNTFSKVAVGLAKSLQPESKETEDSSKRRRGTAEAHDGATEEDDSGEDARPEVSKPNPSQHGPEPGRI